MARRWPQKRTSQYGARHGDDDRDDDGGGADDNNDDHHDEHHDDTRRPHVATPTPAIY